MSIKQIKIIMFLDLQLWPEGSYELGSVLGIGSLVFSETQHEVRDPCCVVRDWAALFEKRIFVQKLGKIGQKWA